jgi:hypothetical protein
MSVDRLDDDDLPQTRDAPSRTALDHAPIERNSRPSAAIEEIPTRDSPENRPDGGWQWKGLELSPHANRAAEAGLALRREAEGRGADGNYTDRGITPAMRRIEAELEHASLAPDTEKFALKSPDRFKEKLAKMATLEPDAPVEGLVANIHDGIRYTFILQSERYVDDLSRARELFEEEDYQLVAFKPSWDRAEYKGVNSQWRDQESGMRFEVQFHTPDSWAAKQTTHDAYEMIESPLTTAEERVSLRAYQRQVCECVSTPPGALELKPYREDS